MVTDVVVHIASVQCCHACALAEGETEATRGAESQFMLS